MILISCKYHAVVDRLIYDQVFINEDRYRMFDTYQLYVF